MLHFDELFGIAASRHGGAADLEAKLGKPTPPETLAAMTDDRWLAILARCVFQAGFNWKVIEAKWDGFEAAFNGFDAGWCAMMDDHRFDALLGDTRIVRNGTKIASVRDNAAFLLELREEGGAGTVLGGWPSSDFVGLLDRAGNNTVHSGGWPSSDFVGLLDLSPLRHAAMRRWPSSDFVGLLDLLKTRGARLGGTTAQYAMRFAGRDSFILSQDVTARLIAERVIDKPATSKRALRAVQEAFNTWARQSDRSLTEISRVLAMSV